jgi:cyclic-di-GMP-binding protein
MADLHSLDIVSRVDFAEIDNAINNTKKAVATRFDFKNAKVEVTFNEKEKKLYLQCPDGKMNALKEMFSSAFVKRGMSIKAIDWGQTLPGPAGDVKCESTVRAGLAQDVSKKIVKMIKDTGLKVQASIQGEEIRLTGKQIDDLRSVMTMLGKAELEVPLQFVNMK